jgi:adenine-specific DNA-methyltransferase
MNSSRTMNQLEANDPATRSADLIAENVEHLISLFPEAFVEGKIDFDVLRQLLGESVNEREEKYGLNWYGKRRARQLALTPSSGTLRPCPSESLDWDVTRNLMIEGDNLEVLKLLQKSYHGRVKMIYVDPPYNTGKDFVYPDDFKDNIRNYLELTGQIESGRKLSSNLEAGGRFHTSWLNMMYPRIKLARSLLREDGVLFVSIDQTEVANLRVLLDEVFGEENFVSLFSWVRTRTPAALSQKTKTVVEYILCYEKQRSDQPLLGIAKPAQSANTLLNQTNNVSELTFPPKSVEAGFVDCTLKAGTYGSSSYTVELIEDVVVKDGLFVTPLRLRAKFRWSQSYLLEQLKSGVHVRVATAKLLPSYEKDDYGREALPNLIDDTVGVGTNESAGRELEDLLGRKVASYPKPLSLLQYLVNSCTSNDDIVLDFFAGSGTTGHGVVSQNAADGFGRRYILVQLPEVLDIESQEQSEAASYCDSLGLPRNLASITEERMRRAAKVLADKNPLIRGDYGFRLFRLASSNVRSWDPDNASVEQTLLDHVDHLVPGRTQLDVLYEILLKSGIDLCTPIQEQEILGKKLFSVGGGVLVACLEERIEPEDLDVIVAGMISWIEQLAPVGGSTCIFRDSLFSSDVGKLNVTAALEQHGMPTIKFI